MLGLPFPGGYEVACCAEKAREENIPGVVFPIWRSFSADKTPSRKQSRYYMTFHMIYCKKRYESMGNGGADKTPSENKADII